MDILAVRGKSRARSRARELRSLARHEEEVNAWSFTTTRNTASGRKPLAPFGLRAAQVHLLRCPSLPMLGHGLRRFVTRPELCNNASSARKNQGRYDKCRINQMKVHQNLTRIRKSTVSSGSCVLIRHITVLHWPGSAASFNIVLARRKQCGGIGTHRNLDPYSPRCLPRKHTELPQQPFNMDV